MAYKRADNNQKEIVNTLRKVGANVIVLSQQGHGFPDLLVAYNNKMYLMEIKNNKTSYGKVGFSYNQKEFTEKWKGQQPYIIYTIEEALKIIGVN